MDVELRHHYGWEVYSTDADNLEDAAKQAVRDTHHFLTDTNHTMEAGKHQLTWAGKKSIFHSVHVFRGEGAPEFSGPAWADVPYWFAVEYRAVRSEASEGDKP